MRQVRPKPGLIALAGDNDPNEKFEAQVVGSLALVECNDGSFMIVHVATGRRVSAPEASIAMVQHLNRECRWTWANEQPFGLKLEGRGATMLKKALETAYASFKP